MCMKRLLVKVCVVATILGAAVSHAQAPLRGGCKPKCSMVLTDLTTEPSTYTAMVGPYASAEEAKAYVLGLGLQDVTFGGVEKGEAVVMPNGSTGFMWDVTATYTLVLGGSETFESRDCESFKPSKGAPDEGFVPEIDSPLNNLGASDPVLPDLGGTGESGCSACGQGGEGGRDFLITIGLGRAADGKPLGHFWFNGTLGEELIKNASIARNTEPFHNLLIRRYIPGNVRLTNPNGTTVVTAPDATFTVSRILKDGKFVGFQILMVPTSGSTVATKLFRFEQDASLPDAERANSLRYSIIEYPGTANERLVGSWGLFGREILHEAIRVLPPPLGVARQWFFEDDVNLSVEVNGTIQRVEIVQGAFQDEINVGGVLGWRTRGTRTVTTTVDRPNDFAELDAKVVQEFSCDYPERIDFIQHYLRRLETVEFSGTAGGPEGVEVFVEVGRSKFGYYDDSNELSNGGKLAWSIDSTGLWKVYTYEVMQQYGEEGENHGLPTTGDVEVIIEWQPWMDGPTLSPELNGSSGRSVVEPAMLALCGSAATNTLTGVSKTRYETTFDSDTRHSSGLREAIETTKWVNGIRTGVTITSTADVYDAERVNYGGARWERSEKRLEVTGDGSQRRQSQTFVPWLSTNVSRLERLRLDESGVWSHEKVAVPGAGVTQTESVRFAGELQSASGVDGAKKLVPRLRESIKMLERVNEKGELMVEECLGGIGEVVYRVEHNRSTPGQEVVTVGGQRLLLRQEANLASGDVVVSETDATGHSWSETRNSNGHLIRVLYSGVSAGSQYEAQPDLVKRFERSLRRGQLVETASLNVADREPRFLGETQTSLDRLRTKVVDEIYQGTNTVFTPSLRQRHESRGAAPSRNRITSYYRDGRVKSITGSMVVPEYHFYVINDGSIAGYPRGSETELVTYAPANPGNPQVSEMWLKTTTNSLGRRLREERPGASSNGSGGFLTEVTTWEYDNRGNVVKQTQTGLCDRLFVFDALNRVVLEGWDLDGSGALEKAGTDEVTETVYENRQHEGRWFEVVRLLRYTTNGSDRDVLSTESWQTIDRRPDSVSYSRDAYGRIEKTWQEISPTAKRVVTRTARFTGLLGGALQMVSGSESSRTEVNGRLVSELRVGTTSPVLYRYDEFGDLREVEEPGKGVTTYTRNSYGQVTRSQSPGGGLVAFWYQPNTAFGTGQLARQVTQVVNEGGGTVERVLEFAYDIQDRRVAAYGNGQYPVKYGFDRFGRMETLTTYQSGTPVWSGSDFNFAGQVTRWAFAPGTNQVLRKTDAADVAVDYVYHPGGLLAARQWARSIGGTRVTANYEWATVSGNAGKRVPGRLIGIKYNDGVTAAVSHSYQRDGTLRATQDAGGMHTFDRPSLLPTQGVYAWRETVTGTSGILQGLDVSYDGIHPSENRELRAQIPSTGTVYIGRQTWDGSGRLATVRPLPTSNLFTYIRNAQSGDLARVESMPLSGGVTKTLHHQFERSAAKGGRLTAQFYTRGSTSWTAGTGVMGWRYTLRSDGSRQGVSAYAPVGGVVGADAQPGWAWDYNSRGDVTGAWACAGAPELGLRL